MVHVSVINTHRQCKLHISHLFEHNTHEPDGVGCVLPLGAFVLSAAHDCPEVAPGSTHTEFFSFMCSDFDDMFTGQKISKVLPQSFAVEGGSGHVLYGLVVSVCR